MTTSPSPIAAPTTRQLTAHLSPGANLNAKINVVGKTNGKSGRPPTKAQYIQVETRSDRHRQVLEPSILNLLINDGILNFIKEWRDKKREYGGRVGHTDWDSAAASSQQQMRQTFRSLSGGLTLERNTDENDIEPLFAERESDGHPILEAENSNGLSGDSLPSLARGAEALPKKKNGRILMRSAAGLGEARRTRRHFPT